MSSARSDLFIIIGVALATTLGLFVLHKWYATFIDMRFHQQLSEAGPTEALQTAREEEQNALNAGKVPLKDAMAQLAQGGRPAAVTPAPSEDISAVSGWIFQRGFKPATAHPVRVPAAPKAVETVPAEAPAEPPQPAAAPAGKPLQLRTGVVKPAAAQ
ncbi:MAG TPA: hypothetical protein VJR89_22930 [Polyangiales bacterium]|nr:hypothetical protein [Polyangiales bacterium]